jgi:hypothetical protein
MSAHKTKRSMHPGIDIETWAYRHEHKTWTYRHGHKHTDVNTEDIHRRFCVAPKLIAQAHAQTCPITNPNTHTHPRFVKATGETFVENITEAHLKNTVEIKIGQSIIGEFSRAPYNNRFGRILGDVYSSSLLHITYNIYIT